MRIVKCDHCKKEFKKESTVYNGRLSFNGGIITGTFDLCESCYRELLDDINKFINREENK